MSETAVSGYLGSVLERPQSQNCPTDTQKLNKTTQDKLIFVVMGRMVNVT